MKDQNHPDMNGGSRRDPDPPRLSLALLPDMIYRPDPRCTRTGSTGDHLRFPVERIGPVLSRFQASRHIVDRRGSDLLSISSGNSDIGLNILGTLPFLPGTGDLQTVHVVRIGATPARLKKGDKVPRSLGIQRRYRGASDLGEGLPPIAVRNAKEAHNLFHRPHEATPRGRQMEGRGRTILRDGKVLRHKRDPSPIPLPPGGGEGRNVPERERTRDPKRSGGSRTRRIKNRP